MDLDKEVAYNVMRGLQRRVIGLEARAARAMRELGCGISELVITETRSDPLGNGEFTYHITKIEGS